MRVAEAPRFGSCVDSSTNPLGRSLRIGGNLGEVRGEENKVKEFRHPLTRLRRYWRIRDLAAHTFNKYLMLKKRVLRVFYIRVVLVNLCNCNDERYPRLFDCAKRVKRLQASRLHPPRQREWRYPPPPSACAKRLKCLVPGSIKKGDRSAIVESNVSGDMLSDAARLARDNIRLSDVIQERRFAKIYVAHHRNDGRSRGPRHKGSISSQKSPTCNRSHINP